MYEAGGGVGYDPEADNKDYSAFSDWLQCYYNPNMKNMVDSNKRTIWFTGPAGPMAPKGIFKDHMHSICKMLYFT